MKMREAILWFDNSDQRETAAKIENAARYYRTKYGIAPDVCFVHHSMIADGFPVVEGIDIMGTNSVLPNHFWLGTHSNEQVKA